MNNTQRQNEILDILLDEGYMSVKKLAQRVHTSEASIRRDLITLEEKGLVQRTYGGAEPINADSVNVSFKMRMLENQQKKKKIASIALKLIKRGTVVFCDSGSTTHFLIQQLPSVKGITVATNGIEALYYLSQHQVKTMSTGGTVNIDNNNSLVGDSVISFWKKMRADIAFFSAQTIDNEGNIFCNYEQEIAGTNAMLNSAAIKVLLCDSSKIGKTATYILGTLREINMVICDKDLARKYSKKFPNVVFLYS